MQRVYRLLAGLALFVALVSPVAAQDTPTPDVVTATPEPVATLVVEPTPPPVVIPPVTPPVSDITVSLGTLAFLLGLTVLAGLGAGAGVGTILFQYLGRKDVRDTLERLYLSASPETQRALLEQLNYARQTIEKLLSIATDVTDGQPNVDNIVAQVVAKIGHQDRTNWGIDQKNQG